MVIWLELNILQIIQQMIMLMMIRCNKKLLYNNYIIIIYELLFSDKYLTISSES